MQGIPTPKDGPLTDATRQRIREAVIAHRDQHGLTNAKLARLSNQSSSYVSQALSGKLAEQHADGALRRLNEAIEADARARAAKRPRKLVKLRPARRLIHFLRRVRALRSMGAAWGPSGVGKSHVGRLSVTEMLGVYVRVTSDSRTRSGLVRALHRAVFGANARVPLRDPLTAIIDRLAGSDRLVLVDEAHQLHADALEVLRDLHDAHGDSEQRIPVVLLGTSEVYEQTQRDADPTRGQLARRVAVRCDLLPESSQRGGGADEWITPEQVQELVEHPRLKLHRSAVQWIRARLLRFTVGLLGDVEYIVDEAVRAARREQGGENDATIAVTLHAAMLQAAVEELRVDRVADFDGVEDADEPVAATA